MGGLADTTYMASKISPSHSISMGFDELGFTVAKNHTTHMNHASHWVLQRANCTVLVQVIRHRRTDLYVTAWSLLR